LLTPSYFTVTNNNVSGSLADGIAISQGLYGMITGNHVSGSADYDCLDATTGAETAGTADTWSNNDGVTSSPAGLCSHPAGPSPPPPPPGPPGPPHPGP
jgi:hypothetical protein